jgi:hypothetical protein
VTAGIEPLLLFDPVPPAHETRQIATKKSAAELARSMSDWKYGAGPQVPRSVAQMD